MPEQVPLASTDLCASKSYFPFAATPFAEPSAEATDEEADHLLDYVTGPQRAATSLLMKRRQ